ncbi:dirigent protein 22-like isoform X2 [Tripterygium wilfordii]|uniref:dirigent protein 22-like isoform X2 n=1 Tax=Tripterygium wilfordii TaxID=458696 RepID=UPI0018F83E2A|nr:dirigent protein 22-like isoform X2 [Tripterygium wilfordii]
MKLFVQRSSTFNALFVAVNGVFSEKLIATKREEKMNHLHFYFHDITSGKNPTAVNIVTAPDGTRSGFGSTVMIDDPLTEEQESTSKFVGRAQGIYAMASQNDSSLLMMLNLVFMEGTYKGSSLSVLGRNPVFLDVREMPIVGGTGLFRLARGYALAHTVWYDVNTGDAIVEYNVYVSHYNTSGAAKDRQGIAPICSLFVVLFAMVSVLQLNGGTH